MPPAPAPAPTLTSAHFSTDLKTTHSVSPLPTLPANIPDPTIRLQILPRDITVQILDIRDMGRSIWSQIQDLEMEARGETVGGRNEIVRVVDEGGGQDEEGHLAGDSTSLGGRGVGGPWKVLLQDAKSKLVWGFDFGGILDGARVGIGCKVLLKRGCRFDRGYVMMAQEGVVVLGGRIEELDRVWRKERIGRLKGLLNQGQR